MIACMITYNDMPLIKTCIESIYNQVDRIIAIDGRYKDFPDGSWLSDDGTLEYLNSLDKVEVIEGAGLYENEKRNLYLECLEDGQQVLVIDTDEEVVGIIPELKADIGLVAIKKNNCSQHIATRLFRYKEGLKYRGVHYVLEFPDGKPYNSRTKALEPYSHEIIDSFYLRHHERSIERKLAKSKYYKKLIQREVAYRKQHKYHIN